MIACQLTLFVTFKASFESNTSNSPATSKIFKMGGFSFPTTAPNNRRPSIEVTPPPPNKPTLPQRGRVLSECVPQKLISPSTPTGKSFPGFHQVKKLREFDSILLETELLPTCLGGTLGQNGENSSINKL